MTQKDKTAYLEWLVRVHDEILDNIHEGVIATNRDGEIIIYNKQLAEFEGLEKKEVLGRLLQDVYDVQFDDSKHKQVSETGEAINEVAHRTTPQGSSGSYLVATTRPVALDGDVSAVFSVSRNVTKIREMYNRAISLLPRGEKLESALENGTRFTFEDVVFTSQKMEMLISAAEKAAVSASPVLVYGNTGAGKELIVQGMHNAGANSKEPFVGVNCAAIPESLLESMLFGTERGAFTGAENTTGIFRQARRGTVYLDEINSMPVNLQAKLLRVLEEKSFRKIGGRADLPLECKIVSSMNKDPMECVREGRLREDLYYRLSVITLQVPPLRERPEDIGPLTEFFVKKYKNIYGKPSIVFNADAKALFQEYTWPGNVRELQHVVERIISMQDDESAVTKAEIPPHIPELVSRSGATKKPEKDTAPEGATFAEKMRNAEMHIVATALAENGYNVTRTAATLKISRQSLQHRMRKLGIRPIETPKPQ
ncbi:MAG: sigma 54-interacting transcriptional regulator [Clostridiales Family XIII bacterium]|nr:sigma 54-interacting transcriptional regulator [Clostridiales Family XIII bacterium]